MKSSKTRIVVTANLEQDAVTDKVLRALTGQLLNVLNEEGACEVILMGNNHDEKPNGDETKADDDRDDDDDDDDDGANVIRIDKNGSVTVAAASVAAAALVELNKKRKASSAGSEDDDDDAKRRRKTEDPTTTTGAAGQKHAPADEDDENPAATSTGPGSFDIEAFDEDKEAARRRRAREKKNNAYTNKRDEAWMERLDDLRQYYEKHGDLCVASDESSGLGRWIADQRHFFKVGKLRKDRKVLLEGVSPEWDKSLKEVRWQGKFEELKQYKADNGHCSPPLTHPTLGRWIDLQRADNKAGKMRSDRKRLLTEIGFIFQAGRKWIKQLRDVEANGGIVRRSKYSSSAHNTVTKDQSKLRDQAWLQRLQELRDFKKKNGHCNVPRGDRTGLGLWVISQRYTKKVGKMWKEREQLLEGVGLFDDNNEEEN